MPRWLILAVIATTSIAACAGAASESNTPVAAASPTITPNEPWTPQPLPSYPPPTSTAMPTPTATPTSTATPTPSPTPAPLTVQERSLLTYVPAAFRPHCQTASPLENVDAGIACAANGTVVSIWRYGPDAPLGPSEIVGPDCPDGTLPDSGEYAVGPRDVGLLTVCDVNGRLSWTVTDPNLLGQVDGLEGIDAAKEWFLTNHPVGVSGPVYGIGDYPNLPRLSYSKLAPMAARVAYRPLLRNIDAYQGHLVRFTGNVILVDGGTAYVWVTRDAYGIWQDEVAAVLAVEGETWITDDVVDFVGFANGTTTGGLGDIPEIDVAGYHIR